MYLVTYFVTNFVSFSVRKYSHFSSPYLVMYLVIYFVTFLVKSHVLLYWRSIIGATKYRTYLYCLLTQFYGDFRFNLALVVSSLIINLSCPLLSFGAECPPLTLLNWQYLKNLFSQSSISWWPNFCPSPCQNWFAFSWDIYLLVLALQDKNR